MVVKSVVSRELLFVKVGGSVITDKSVEYKMRDGVLDRLVSEIVEGVEGVDGLDLVIGHGAGSFGHFSAKKYGVNDGFSGRDGGLGVGIVRLDVIKLNRIVIDSFLSKRFPVFCLSPSSMFSVSKGEVDGVFMNSFLNALKVGLVPVVCGDVMVDSVSGSCVFSTERVFDVLIRNMDISLYDKVRVVHVSGEDGVLCDGEVVPRIGSDNWDSVKGCLYRSDGVDVTGGMLHKIESCMSLLDMGVESCVVNGLMAGRVRDVIVGKSTVCTRISDK